MAAAACRHLERENGDEESRHPPGGDATRGIAGGTGSSTTPERIIDDTRVSYECPGGLIITEDGGHYEVLFAMRSVGRDLLRVIFAATAKQVTASDEHGNRYRIVGSGSGTWLTDDPEADEPLQGQFGIRLNILAEDGGLVGRTHYRGHLRPDGTLTVVERGDCIELGVLDD